MTQSPVQVKRPTVPMGRRIRTFIALAATVWTAVGFSLAVARYSAVVGNSGPFFIATIFLALLAGVGAIVFALRGKRRDTMLCLVLSSIYPTYFWWVLSFIPIALIVCLMLDSLRISVRNPLVSRRKIQLMGLFVLAVMAGTIWLMFHSDPMASTETKRVQRAFHQMADKVSKNETTPTPWLTPVSAGEAVYPDGSKASLWVPKPSILGNRANCFYVDKPTKNGATGFFYFGCTPAKVPVILARQGSVVVGFVSMPRATYAKVSTSHLTEVMPVTNGYFLLPAALSLDPSAKFTITFTEPGQATCTVKDLVAPGVSAAEECVIA